MLPYLHVRPQNGFGIERAEVKGFRSAREVSFSPGTPRALVGEANAGKSNLLAAIHDSDRRASGKLIAAERALNTLIADTAGAERTVVLDPDFEAVAGLTGGSRKPERAWREFASRPAAEMPAQLAHAAELAISLARAQRFVPSANSPRSAG